MEGSTSYTKSHGMFGEWKLGSRSLIFGLSWPFVAESSLMVTHGHREPFKPTAYFDSLLFLCVALPANLF